MKTKLIIPALSILFCSSPAWCGGGMEAPFVEAAKDVAIIGASSAGCAAGVTANAAFTRGQTSFKRLGASCLMGGAVTGGVVAGIGAAVADEAPAAEELDQTSDNE